MCLDIEDWSSIAQLEASWTEFDAPRDSNCVGPIRYYIPAQK